MNFFCILDFVGQSLVAATVAQKQALVVPNCLQKQAMMLGLICSILFSNSIFLFLDLCNLQYFLSSAYFGFNCSSFSSYLRWKLKLLSLRFFFFSKLSIKFYEFFPK